MLVRDKSNRPSVERNKGFSIWKSKRKKEEEEKRKKDA